MPLLPPSLDEWLPEGHLARFVAELVDDVLDLSPILASYTDKCGFPPYDPWLMAEIAQLETAAAALLADAAATDAAEDERFGRTARTIRRRRPGCR